MVLRIQPGDFHSMAAQQLVAQLEAHLWQCYPTYQPDVCGMQAADLDQPRSGFWLADWDGEAVGCVAIRPLTDAIAELKRLYVTPTHRGQGIGWKLLQTAEKAAIAWNYTQIWLETGELLTASVRLYRRAGYRPIPCFGNYTDDPESRCYGKSLRQ